MNDTRNSSGIQKRALFYWDSGELPLERKLSVDTFRKQNPDWTVEIHGDPKLPGATPVHRSDLWRYKILHEKGGFYFDTDIVWLKPVPEDWLSHDVALTYCKDIGFHNIAALGAVKGAKLWEKAYQFALQRIKSRDYSAQDYQFLGTTMLNKLYGGHHVPAEEKIEGLEREFECSILNLDPQSIVPVSSFDAGELFANTKPRWWPEVIGVHWFGGYTPDEEKGGLGLDEFIHDLKLKRPRTLIGRTLKAALK